MSSSPRSQHNDLQHLRSHELERLVQRQAKGLPPIILPSLMVEYFLLISGAVGSVATAISAAIAVSQLSQMRKQARTDFEDSLSREYRALEIPRRALMGDELTDAEIDKDFDVFYDYFDLSNEQVFLRQIDRVTPNTWKFWCDGIKSNFARPAFERAWKRVKEKCKDDFRELRELKKREFKGDPKDWPLKSGSA